MTVTNTTRKAGPFNGDDATVVFAFTYKTFAAADVLVVLTDSAGVEAIQVLTTDYSVTLNTDQNVSPGGTVTMVVAPATGELLTLGSDMDETQPSIIRNLGPFRPDVLEDMVDRNTMSIQQQLELLSRVLQIPISDDPSRVVELPTETLRANKVLAFGANGDVDVAEFNSGDVPDATTVLKGIIEIATLAEMTTGTDPNRAATPQGVKQQTDLKALLAGSIAQAFAISNLQFPPSQVPSADANNLDDYEEGTWTPVLGGSGGTSGQSYSTQLGIYTKIGNKVYCSCSMVLTAKGTITGNVQILGLPFTSKNSGGATAGVSIGRQAIITLTAGHMLQGYVATNSVKAWLLETDYTGDAAVEISTGAIANTTQLIASFSYQV